MHVPYTEFGGGKKKQKQKRAKDKTKIARNPIAVLKWLVKSEGW